MSDYRQLLSNFGGNARFVTLTTNCHLNSQKNWTKEFKTKYYRKLLYQWDAMTMRKLLGKSYFKPEHREKRQHGILIYENAITNLHFHAAIDIRGLNLSEYKVAANKSWMKLVPSGDMKEMAIHDIKRLAGYNTKTKTLTAMECEDSMFFLPAPMKKGNP